MRCPVTYPGVPGLGALSQCGPKVLDAGAMGRWVRQPELPEGESITTALAANRQVRWRAVGGRLFVTNERLILEPNAVDRRSGGGLRAKCDGMSSRVLYDRLRDPDSSGLVERTSDGDYELSQMGASLGAALEPLDTWAESWATSLHDSVNDA